MQRAESAAQAAHGVRIASGCLWYIYRESATHGGVRTARRAASCTYIVSGAVSSVSSNHHDTAGAALGALDNLSTLGRLQGQLLYDRHNSYAQERHYPENATNLSEQ